MVTLAHRSPGATVWAVDVNARALDLTRANAAAAHRWLRQRGWAVVRRTSRAGYRVLDVADRPPERANRWVRPRGRA